MKKKNRKIPGFSLILKRKSGIILLSVLWIIAILSMLAVGLGRSMSVDLSLTKYSIGKLKSYYLARAGLIQAIQLIKIDSLDEEAKEFDSLYQCGMRLEEAKTLEDIFKDVAIEQDGSYRIGFREKNFGQEESKDYYGFTDEERKLNLNGLNKTNYKVLKELLLLLDVEEDKATMVASSVVDWKDEDGEVTNPPFGAEDGDYISKLFGSKETDFLKAVRSLHIKNKPFDSIEEILLVKGMDQEMFEKLKGFITIYPKDAKNLTVNFETAPRFVLSAMGRNFVGSVPDVKYEDADAMAEKLLTYRSGEDNLPYTQDDQIISQDKDLEQLYGFTSSEKNLFNLTQEFRVRQSRFLRINVTGVDKRESVESSVESVVDRKDLSLVYWRRN